MTEEEVYQLLSFLQERYSNYNFTFDEEKLFAWHKMLKDQSAETVMKRAENYARVYRCLPSLAELRENDNERLLTGLHRGHKKGLTRHVKAPPYLNTGW